MFAAQQSMPLITRFPDDMIIVEGEPGRRCTYARDLDLALGDCYEGHKLPSELHFKWAQPGKMQIIRDEVEMRDAW
jgi:hypothetical protein